MAASDFINTVQGMYVAYYGRFADQTGLSYWSNQLNSAKGNLTQIINSFGNSAEANGIYGSLTNSAKIEALYQNLFGHAADAAGKNYYAGLLSTGAATGADIAKRILDGASGNDWTILQSKLSAANNLTNSVYPSDYSGDAAATAARTLIASVVSQSTADAANATAFYAAKNPAAAPTTVDTISGASIGDAGNYLDIATVFSGSGTTNITGKVGGSDIFDNYKFTATTNGVAIFNLTELTRDLDIHLYDTAFHDIASSAHNGVGDESFTYNVLAGQTYLLAVEPYNGAVSNYNLTAILPSSSTTPTPVPPIAPTEDKINGVSVGDATASPSNFPGSGTTTITGSLGGSDTVDAYIFTATLGGVANFKLSGLTASSLYFSLVDNVSNELASDFAYSNWDGAFTYSVEVGQTYMLGVQPYKDAASNYTLTVNLPSTAASTVVDVTSLSNNFALDLGTGKYTVYIDASKIAYRSANSIQLNNYGSDDSIRIINAKSTNVSTGTTDTNATLKVYNNSNDSVELSLIGVNPTFAAVRDSSGFNTLLNVGDISFV